MKQGLESVEKLVERANVLASLKRDYVADVRKTYMHYDGDDVFSLGIEGEAVYSINDVALRQMGSWAHIPMSYINCLLYTSPRQRDNSTSRMPTTT